MRSWKLYSAACAAVLATFGLAPASMASGTSGSAQSLCIAHHPQDFVWYTHSCTGHDEPEIDPLSTHAGSAQDLTWTIVLPTDGTRRRRRSTRSGRRSGSAAR